ncbi:adenosine deaminase [Clostridium cellulovorans]|uniref:adenosine deaminase n=1 Tax=Clostridium cellulovorans (strain ATCC 35296 / DSM 3052 / OCM 3 / 743B) TaxID=573061 RepID=D9SNJ8_CLOC7|nr:adenosine deaminase [Clostridium cellulovorans]ADL53990.1 adenosine deaminase [Clostridium cellulovorans 743B]
MNRLDKIKKIPKVELHCHLDGSIRVETMFELCKDQGLISKNISIKEFATMVQLIEPCNSLKKYLEKFSYAIEVLQSKENIKRIAFELIEDASIDGVMYIEIRFAPLNHTARDLTEDEIIEAVITGAEEGKQKYNVSYGIILCAMRHEGIERSRKVIELAAKHKSFGVVGVDLAGNEQDYGPELFIDAFVEAEKKGLHITVHAGETGNEENIVKSVKLLKARRIGHGIHAYKNPEVIKFLIDNQIPLEMCPTSNVDTNAVDNYKSHPILDYLRKGIKVTLSTDNRTVSRVTLSEEYNMLMEQLNLNANEMQKLIENGIDVAFCSEELKKQLREQVFKAKNIMSELN